MEIPNVITKTLPRITEKNYNSVMSIQAGYWYRKHADDSWRCNFTDTELLDTASPDTFSLTEAKIAQIALRGDDPEMKAAAKNALDSRYQVDPGLAIAARQALEKTPKENPIRTEPATVSDIFTKERLNIGTQNPSDIKATEQSDDNDHTPT